MLNYEIHINGKVASEPLGLAEAIELYRIYMDQGKTLVEIKRITD